MFQSENGVMQEDILEAEIRRISRKLVIGIISQAVVKVVRDYTLPQTMMSNQMDQESQDDIKIKVQAQSITSDVIAHGVGHLVSDELQNKFPDGEAKASDSALVMKATAKELSSSQLFIEKHRGSIAEKRGFFSPTDLESWDYALFNAAIETPIEEKVQTKKDAPEKIIIVDESQKSDDTLVDTSQSGDGKSDTLPSQDRRFIYELASSKIPAQKDSKRRVEQRAQEGSENTENSEVSLSSLGPDITTETGQTVSVSTVNFMETDASSASEHDEVVEINGMEFVLNSAKIKDYSRVIKIIATIPDIDTSCNVIFFNTKYLPRRSDENYEDLMGNIFVYCVKFLRETLVSNFVIIYLNSPCHPESVPSMLWLKRHFTYLEYNFRKNIKKLYLVNPSFWTRAFLFFMRPFFNAKFWKKLMYVSSYHELQILLPAVNIPADEWNA